MSTSRTRQAFNVLAAMLDAAVANAMIVRNMARGVELPRLVAAQRRFLCKEQVARLADAIDPAYRLLVRPDLRMPEVERGDCASTRPLRPTPAPPEDRGGSGGDR